MQSSLHHQIATIILWGKPLHPSTFDSTVPFIFPIVTPTQGEESSHPFYGQHRGFINSPNPQCKLGKRDLLLELRSAWPLSCQSIQITWGLYYHTRCYQTRASPSLWGSDTLSAVVHELELGTQESPHFLRVKDDSEFGSGGMTEFWLRATQSSWAWFAGLEWVSSPSEAEAGSKWGPWREAARSCPSSQRAHLPGGKNYFNSFLKKKIAGGRLAKICIECDFSHTQGSCQNRIHMLSWSQPSGVWVWAARPRPTAGAQLVLASQVWDQVHVAKTPSGTATLEDYILERKVSGLILTNERKPNWGAWKEDRGG